MKIAVIIPARNEELTIRDVIRSFYRELPEASIYIIDNASHDKTNCFARETLAEVGCEGAVMVEEMPGKANAVRRGFSKVNADIYVLVDADMTYPANVVRNLIKPVLDGQADMVVGDRRKTGAYRIQNERRFHDFGNKLVCRLINFLFHSNLNDILSGYRVFNQKLVKNFPIMKEGFTLETELTLHALDKRFVIKEIPISYKTRPAGSFSKINTLGDGVKVIKLIFEVFKVYRPLVFFSALALFFFLAGLLLGAPVLIEFAQTGRILHIPLTILATGLMVLSLVAFSMGIILDTIVANHRFQYELLLLKYISLKSKNANSNES
jgi:glycosyltransferase involved in cell wall biosynthesis